MKLKDFISEEEVYKRVEDEIRQWVEKTYKHLSIEFYPNNIEIVRTNKLIDYSPEEVSKITEVVNLKI